MGATLTTSAKVAVGAGAGLVVGALLPWAVVRAPLVGQITKAGIEGDGMFTAGIGVVAILVAVASNSTRKATWLLLLAIAAGLIAFVDLTEVLDMAGENALIGAGAGLYLTLLSAGVLLWASTRIRSEDQQATPQPDVSPAPAPTPSQDPDEG
jgi:hypothetical protein